MPDTLNDVSDFPTFITALIILPFPFRPFFTHIPSFPTVQERKRDDGVTNRRYRLMIYDSKLKREKPHMNVGFFPFQFRIVLTVLPSFKERSLAISLSASLKSRFGDQVHENFATNQNLALIMNLPPRKVTWYDLFRSFLHKLKNLYPSCRSSNV